MIGEDDEGYQEIEYELERPTPTFRIVGNVILVACLLLILAWPFTKPLVQSWLPQLPMTVPVKKTVGEGRCMTEHATVITRFEPRPAGTNLVSCYAVDDPMFGRP